MPLTYLLNAERRTGVAIAWAWLALLLTASLGALGYSFPHQSSVATAVYGSGADTDQAVHSSQRLVLMGGELKRAPGTGSNPFLLAASHDLRRPTCLSRIAVCVGEAPLFAWRYTSSVQARAPPRI